MTKYEPQNLAVPVHERQRRKLSRSQDGEEGLPARFALEDYLQNSPKRMRSARARPPG